MGEENSALGISMRLLQNPEIEELERRTDALEKLPPMQQSLCVGFVLGAGATENTKKDEKEAG